MAISNFARNEQKYRLSAAQCKLIMGELKGHMRLDEYGETRVDSCYWDTPWFELIDRSLDKPLYKEKLRVRSYGNPDQALRVFVEIKKKFKGVVYKRRVGMSPKAAWEFLNGAPYEQCCKTWPIQDELMQAESLSAKSLQIAREIRAMMNRYEGMAPAIDISCLRSAYLPALHAGDDTPDDLRITFDRGLVGRYVGQGGEAWENLIGPGEQIMEIKTAHAMPVWLVSALSEAQAYTQSFSKVGTAYLGARSRPAHARVS